MADNAVWSPKSPNIPNGQIKIANPPDGTSRNNIQTDWTQLNPNSANQAVKNLEYRVNDFNVVEFRYPTTNDPNGPKSTATSIQEIADDSLYVSTYGYTPATTELIKDSLRRELTSQADSIGWTNTASGGNEPTAPQEDSQGGNPSAPTLPSPPNYKGQEMDLQATQLKIVKEPYIQYPDKMGPEQDKIKFTAVKIKPRDQVNTGDTLGFEFGKPQYEKVDNPIYLAIQAPISDQNSVEWGADNVTAIDAALYHESYKLMGGTLEQAGKNLEDALNRIYSVANAQSERIKRAMAGKAASLNNVLARTDNVVLNPNMELLFQGPQLRPFTFSFKMSAREPGEAERVKRIIKYFKYHMAVRREANQLFLRAPNVFTIQYIKGNEKRTDELHPGINLISPTDDTKACALTNCSVDYTPLGSYATYADGTMVSYTLSLQFQEITPVYDTDYNDYPHPIGF